MSMITFGRLPSAALAGAVALAVGLGAAPALSMVCAPYEDYTKRLTAKYAEYAIGAGSAGEGRAFEVWASDDGSWTAIVVQPLDGVLLACPIALGEAWQKIERNLPRAQGMPPALTATPLGA